jgi:hypothetical protein
MSLYLLDDSLSVEVFYDPSDEDYCDNICLRFWESCPEEEKIFKAGETNVFLTPAQAQMFARMLLDAAETSNENCKE